VFGHASHLLKRDRLALRDAIKDSLAQIRYRSRTSAERLAKRQPARIGASRSSP